MKKEKVKENFSDNTDLYPSSSLETFDYWQTEELDILRGSASVGHVVLDFLLFFVLMFCYQHLKMWKLSGLGVQHL